MVVRKQRQTPLEPGVGRAANGQYYNQATRFGVSALGAVPIPANDTGTTPTPQLKWINVANEGEYKGHHQGEFALTPEVLQQLVDNLHNSPQYASGPVELTLSDGTTGTQDAGTQDVVQFDYEHASEMAPWEGSIPSSGAPAIGWVRDLEVRAGPDGRQQLWALAWLGDQIRGQIDRAEYKWVSIAWNPKGVHWQTGEPIGAVLTSIAFTNHPFLQDLESLAAANRALTPAKDAPRAAGQPRKPGVEREPRSSAGGTRGLSIPVARERDPMPPEVKALLTRLCSIFGLIDQADPNLIIRAAETAAQSGGKLQAVLAALGVQNADAALSSIPELVAAKGTIEQLLSELNSLMTADQSADAADVAPQDVAAAMSSRGWSRNGFADPLLSASVLAARNAIIDAEISKVPTVQVTLPNGSKVQLASAGAKRVARANGRKAFLASYGVNLDPGTAHLSQTFVAGPGASPAHVQYPPQPGGHAAGVQLTALPQLPYYAPTGAQPPAPVMFGQPQPSPFGVPPLPGNAPAPSPGIDWIALGGRNITEKVISYLSTVDAKFKDLEHGQQISRASAWKRANPHLLPQSEAA